MGRPKTFDDDEVLDQMVACFRLNGFDSTSIRDLETATGLKAASLYKAFGNKNQLFALALVRYRAEVIDRRIASYLTLDRGVEAIIDFFTSTYKSEPLPHLGCLFTTSAVEASLLDPDSRKVVESGLAGISAALHDHLERCQSTGELAMSVNIDNASTGLLMLYEGLLVLLRSSTDTDGFDESLRLSISSLLATTPNTTQRKKQ